MNRRRLLKYGIFGAASTALPATLGALAKPAAGPSDEIAYCAIHPAIGIARVGNSPSAWFLGPEAPGPHPLPADRFKDAAGRIKRQAARFRLYGMDAAGNVIAELTGENAEITWTVHLANTKAAWYNFDIPLDIPGAEGESPAPLQPAAPLIRSARRNAEVADRAQLRIDPGARSISGRSTNRDADDAQFAFSGGRFFDREVPLGELRTDDAGRLFVFGGFGHSAPAIPGLLASTFANNDLWHDDVSDGPVDATVRVNGREIPVTGAWVVVAPPNFAPGIQGVVTLYDLLFDVATRLEPTLSPRRPSFSRQIYPLFARMVQNQWVNAGFLRDFGWGSASNFLEPSVLARLTDPSPDYQFLRWQVFSRFRDPAYLSMEYNDLPPYYGDGVELPAANPRQWMAVLQTQHLWLRQWADGEFDADWPPGGVQFASQLEQIPLDEQPAALDRAALDECLGGPFHPGCEMTWPMRHASLYSSPFRLHRRIEPEPDWGEAMTSAIALAPDGPLSGSGPGDLTRWMAVPWQTDTSSCLSRYKVEVDDYLPTFWPARVPNDVLSWQSYQKVVDPSLSLEERQAAFVRRDKWLRPLPEIRAEAVARINAFLQEWDRAGVVTQSPGPTDDAPFPDQFWVERDHALTGLGAESPSLATPPAS